jgi:hypothetical protein
MTNMRSILIAPASSAPDHCCDRCFKRKKCPRAVLNETLETNFKRYWVCEDGCDGQTGNPWFLDFEVD